MNEYGGKIEQQNKMILYYLFLLKIPVFNNTNEAKFLKDIRVAMVIPHKACQKCAIKSNNHGFKVCMLNNVLADPRIEPKVAIKKERVREFFDTNDLWNSGKYPYFTQVVWLWAISFNLY